ncbi:MAG: beta-propeller domain-containing protein [Sandaracinaceae bacterium]|nr:beta-propeller domain-containing protein [Sandaracinaceae bacterium]
MTHIAYPSAPSSRPRRTGRAVTTVVALLLSACASGTTSAPTPAESGLQRMTSCADLEQQLRADAESKVRAEAERMLADYANYRDGVYVAFPTRDVDFSGGPLPVADGGSPPTGGPEHYTETNTQVAGVDEPDFVKTDGGRIFLLHGQSVFALRSWPADATAETGRANVEGSPLSMFLRGDTLVVFSSVQFADPDGSTPPIAFLPFPADAWGPYYPYAYREFTKISLYDVSGDLPRLEGERYVEGSYRAARRHDDVVRVVMRSDTWQPQWGGARPQYWNDRGDMVGEGTFRRHVAAWLDERLDEVRTQDLDGFLPEEWVRAGGELVAVPPRCTDFYAAAPGQTDYGMTQVLALTLDDAGTSGDVDLTRSAFVLGDSSVVYANHEALVIAQSDWAWNGWSPWGGAVSTRLHRFDLDDASTTYRASGRVAGQINNQFSLDEQDGVLRVAVTEDRWIDANGQPVVIEDGDPWREGRSVQPVSRVLTLDDVAGKLTELDRSADLAPGERLFSTRFVGDTAYVVTFRQVDPLFVVDLSDPSDIVVRGEVEIPGFSTYMHPLDETHLLTIGRNIDPATQQDLGMQLQIFDVSAPDAPVRTHAYTVMGYSQAQYDHLAFNYDARLGLLAIPLETYGETFESTLSLFSVSLVDGIAPAGTIAHTALFDGCLGPDGYYGCSYTASVRRGLFIEDFVYTISLGGVTAHALDDLNTSLATVPLPEPEWYQGYYGPAVDFAF